MRRNILEYAAGLLHKKTGEPSSSADDGRTVDFDVVALETAHTLPLVTAHHCSSNNTDSSKSTFSAILLVLGFNKHLPTTQVRHVHQHHQPEFHRHKR